MVTAMLEKRLQQVLAASRAPLDSISNNPIGLWHDELSSLLLVPGKARALRSTLLGPTLVRGVRVAFALAQGAIARIQDALSKDTSGVSSFSIDAGVPDARIIVRAWQAVHPPRASPPPFFDENTPKCLLWNLARLMVAVYPFVRADQRDNLTRQGGQCHRRAGPFGRGRNRKIAGAAGFARA